MILNHTEIAKLVTNCLTVKKRENGRTEFIRMTDKQMEIYDRTKFPGAHCDPCMCFDFLYDGQIIAFEFFPIYKTSRNFLSFDLYADDTMVHSLFTYADAEGERQFFYKFPTKEKRRIRLFLPFSVGIELWSFTLDDGSHYEPTPTEGRKKILFLGDSITHGYDTHYTSMSYAATVARHYDAVCLNQAVGGYIFNADMIDEALPFDPDAITVAYGTNDWGRYGADEEKYREAAKSYIDKLCTLYADKHIFGLLPVWRADEDRRPERMPFEKVYTILRECYAAHPNVTIIEGSELVPNLRPFYTDGLHPNTIGQHVYGLNVIEAMEKAGFKK